MAERWSVEAEIGGSIPEAMRINEREKAILEEKKIRIAYLDKCMQRVIDNPARCRFIQRPIAGIWQLFFSR